MRNHRIIAEKTGGPDVLRLVEEDCPEPGAGEARVKVSAAYGSDIDLVERVLLECASEIDHVSDAPTPRVRFRSFGESGLDFELLAWVDEPVYRGSTLHRLNCRVYKAFAEAGIEIPYNKLDLYIKERAPVAVDAPAA